MFPSILIRTGVFRDRFAVNAILYVSQICLNKIKLFSKLIKFSKISLKLFSKIKFGKKKLFLNLNSRKWSGIEWWSVRFSQIFLSLKRERIFMEPPIATIFYFGVVFSWENGTDSLGSIISKICYKSGSYWFESVWDFNVDLHHW